MTRVTIGERPPTYPSMPRAVLLVAVVVAAPCVACRERPHAIDARPPESHAAAPTSPPPAATASTARAAASAKGPADPADEARVALPIGARAHAGEAPPAGWCGETAIQEALLYYGVWAPQRAINRAGRPAHPDLYSNEMPAAMEALGLRLAWYAPRARGFDAFAEWARTAIDAGEPVLAGVKLLPTEHPEWGLDHFVLVVGYGERGLLVNTTWGHRQWIAKGATKGISLDSTGWAARVRGVTLPTGMVPARLVPVGESAAEITLRATCPAGFHVENRSSEVADLSVAEGTVTHVRCAPVRPR